MAAITGSFSPLLDDKLKDIQDAMEDRMKKYTLLDLREEMRGLLAKEADCESMVYVRRSR